MIEVVFVSKKRICQRRNQNSLRITFGRFPPLLFCQRFSNSVRLLLLRVTKYLEEFKDNHMISVGPNNGTPGAELSTWRRKCGCVRTSEKLKKILHSFPSPPPPTPTVVTGEMDHGNKCVHGYYAGRTNTAFTSCDLMESKKLNCRTWEVISELVKLVQLSVTATALALYYIIYCYMQLVYYTLRSALYFHNADGPMKITIAVVTATSLVVGFNILLRLERIIGILY